MVSVVTKKEIERPYSQEVEKEEESYRFDSIKNTINPEIKSSSSKGSCIFVLEKENSEIKNRNFLTH